MIHCACKQPNHCGRHLKAVHAEDIHSLRLQIEDAMGARISIKTLEETYHHKSNEVNEVIKDTYKPLKKRPSSASNLSRRIMESRLSSVLTPNNEAIRLSQLQQLTTTPVSLKTDVIPLTSTFLSSDNRDLSLTRTQLLPTKTYQSMIIDNKLRQFVVYRLPWQCQECPRACLKLFQSMCSYWCSQFDGQVKDVILRIRRETSTFHKRKLSMITLNDGSNWGDKAAELNKLVVGFIEAEQNDAKSRLHNHGVVSGYQDIRGIVADLVHAVIVPSEDKFSKVQQVYATCRSRYIALKWLECIGDNAILAVAGQDALTKVEDACLEFHANNINSIQSKFRTVGTKQILVMLDGLVEQFKKAIKEISISERICYQAFVHNASVQFNHTRDNSLRLKSIELRYDLADALKRAHASVMTEYMNTGHKVDMLSRDAASRILHENIELKGYISLEILKATADYQVCTSEIQSSISIHIKRSCRERRNVYKALIA